MRVMILLTINSIISDKSKCKKNRKSKLKNKAKMTFKNKYRDWRASLFQRKIGCCKEKLNLLKDLLTVFSKQTCSLALALD